MQYINEKWLKIFNYYYFAFSLVFFGLYVYFAVEQQSLAIQGREVLGVSLATGVFAVANVLYNLTLLRLIKKSNIWLAYLISFSLFALLLNAAVETSLEFTSSYIFIAQSVIITFFATTFGPIVSIFLLAIIGVVFAMTVSGTTDPTLLGIKVDAFNVAIRIAGVSLLLYLLKDKYITVGPTQHDNYIQHYFVNNEVVKLLTDSIADGVIIIDKNENIKSINPGALSLIKKDIKEAVDLDYRSVLNMRDLNHEKLKPEDEPIAKALKEKQTVNQELILLNNDNQELYIDISISVIMDPQSEELYGAVIILRDFSKKKKEEAARSEFISTASHEMRTPVAAIEGYLGLALNDKVSTIDSRARGYLEKAHSSTEHLGRLFQDLLLSAKAEDGRLVNNPELVEMGHFLEQLVDSLRFSAEKKGLLLDFTIGASSAEQADTMNGKVIKPLYYTHIDPDRIREVITNLFDNAVKYTDTGKISVGLTGNNEIIQLFIKDTGPGIPESDVQHLFQKFYRVDNSATRTIGGTGLGLFICRKIIEMYHGRIWAESEVGKGSTFYINLPRINNQKAAEMQKNINPADQAAATAAATQTPATSL